jgi:fructose-bisphosphate aldolase class II
MASISEPRLDLDRLAQIRKRVDVPLVLHGGSGLSHDDFRAVIAGGIVKINIYTDVITAGKKAREDNLDKGYSDMLEASKNAMRKVVTSYLDIFGSSGKA